MKQPLIMTPGPTYVREDVRKALSREITNPDLDKNFFEFYKETCKSLKQLLNTKNDVLILCGEGILGLEAACASLIEPGDRVLCIDNGIFGNGFGDFAGIYGGNVQYFRSDYRRAVNIEEEEGNYVQRHSEIAGAVRHAFIDAGMELYPYNGFSNTVTTVTIPEGVSFNDIYDEMLASYNIMIAGAFDFLKDKVFRIGHMGENCHEDKLYLTLKGLDRVFRKLGIEPKVELHKTFIENL